MLARLTAFVVWALVAAVAVFWGLRLFVRAQPAPSFTVAVGESVTQRGDLSRLLGATPREASAPTAAPELASRFRLLGVMAAKPPATTGFATIAVDSRPARTYAVGAALDGDLVLQSVSLRAASIGPAQGTPALTLEIPFLPAAATGTLPQPSNEIIRPSGPAPVPSSGQPPAPSGIALPAPMAPGQVLPGQMPPPQPLPGRTPRTPGPTSR